MKKTISFILCVILTISMMSTTALAINSVTWTKNTTLVNKYNNYADVVIEEGINVNIAPSQDPKEPNGLWISNSLTIKKGATLTGNGILILEKGVTVTGITLYYIVKGEARPFDEGISILWDSGVVRDGDTGLFEYNAKLGLWYFVTQYDFGDPFYKERNADNHNNNDFTVSDKTAKKLNYLGIVLGSGANADGTINFNLNSPATRAEALTMLIRFLGKEAEAKNGNYQCPFTDVEDWAKPYVGYAYENGLTNGVSDTEFGTGYADANMFFTFVLRALGYSDKDGLDFTWSNAKQLAIEKNIVPSDLDTSKFLRADMFIISDAALNAFLKDSDIRLSDKLISDGVFTYEQLFEASKMMH